MAMGYWLSYAVSTSHSFSPNDAFTSILAQIPFDAVGVLAIAVFTLFMYSTLVDRLSLALFASVLLAFVAVIFDLAQLLARGGASRAVSGTDPGIVQGFVAVREICLALSLSLRFTWFSAFIVRTPRGLEPQEGVSTGSSSPGPFSWRRVGVAGLVIKWMLLVMVATLFGLQVTWRMVQAFSYSGPVYFTSVGLEFVLVVIIGGKAIVNFVVAERDQRWSLLRSYAIPLLALILEFVVAAGDLGVFPFSETVLGRFLQGVEMYLLLLWTMANAFQRNAGPMLRIPDEPPTLPMDFPQRQSTLRLSLHNITPHSRQASQHEKVSIQEKRAQRGRASVASRSSLTSWVGNKRILRSQAPYQNDDERLWVQDQAERGFSPAVADDEKSFHRISEEQLPETEAPVRSKWDDAMFTALSESPEQVDDLRVFEAQSFALSVVNTPTGPDNLLRNDYEFQPSAPASSFARSASPSIQWKVEVHPPAGDLPAAKHDSSLIVPTLSDTDHEGSSGSPDVLVPPRALGASFTVPDSPVYGLEGISRPPLEKSSTSRSNFMHMSTTSSLTSRTDIEEVLRRQQELDRSIQKLNITPSSNRSSIANEQVSQPSRISSISGVSLAQFPAPPWVRRSLMTNSRSSLRRSRSIQFAVETPIRETRRRSASIDSVDMLQPPQMPAALSERHVSVPETLRDSVSELDVEEGSLSRSPRFESQGTEYVITSFIGDLSSGQPIRQRQDSRPSVDSSEPTNGTARSSLVLHTAERTLASKPILLPTSRSPPAVGGLPTNPRPVPQVASRDTLRASPAAVKGPRSALSKGMISGPRPLRPKSDAQPTDVYEQPRKAPAAPNSTR